MIKRSLENLQETRRCPRIPWIVTGGYYGMPDRTAESFRNLWFHTGDSLVQDADGWLWFVDRIHDRIRRRGENIASAYVELVLTQHGAVAEAAVVAVPSELAGGEDELPKTSTVKVRKQLLRDRDVTPATIDRVAWR